MDIWVVIYGLCRYKSFFVVEIFDRWQCGKWCVFFNRTLEETVGNVTYGYLIHQQYQF